MALGSIIHVAVVDIISNKGTTITTTTTTTTTT
eukprot:CAMPEP_0118698050 /NCGR_PEP_ID=MMETSP0800-20121206/14948_1 /TAXON_ID=210618 ORGANISM="Striatella unipunctata, Strain CCMP2910" /NCGR_SAMPLE_ID=MMETSP0800 /ASSEMBLY_ACC=CAM_ASM_000638 /LENGTH=32 /DNA_ID= /DNA_START= /DNA_END= /DNA_ORIENTATION=